MNPGIYKEVEGLVKFMARKFGAPGHFALDPEELEAEGRLKFAQIYMEHQQEPYNDLLARFKTSLYNHLKSLLDKHRYTRKSGYEAGEDGEDGTTLTDTYIDLSDVADSIGYQAFTDVYYAEYVESMLQLLPAISETRKLFLACVDVPKELEDLAINESMRKSHVAKQGILVRNAEVVRVKQKHIAQYLGWTTAKVGDHLQILRKMAHTVIYESDQNLCESAV